MSFLWVLFLAFVVFVTSAVGQGDNELAKAAVMVLIPSAIALYFSPSLIAAHRKHAQSGAITILNLLLGWTVIGWVGAMVWAYIEPAKAESRTVERKRHPANAAMRACPYCAEDVRVEAIKCRHCQSDLTPLGTDVPAGA